MNPTEYPRPDVPMQDNPNTVVVACCLFGEGRSEGPAGVAAIAAQIRNRVFAPRNATGKRFGLSWKGVILHPGAYDAMRPEDPNYPKLLYPLRYEPQTVWEMCYRAAEAAIYERPPDPTQGATHYHDASVLPWWAAPEVIAAGRMLPTVSIGRLRFYREP